MLRLLHIELRKLAYSRLFYASLVLLLLYALVLLIGFRAMMRTFGIENAARQSGAMYVYMSFVLSFYPFVTAIAIIFAGGAVAPELRAGTLRYSLIAPVGRPEYLLVKFMMTGVAVTAAVVFLFLAVGGLGALLFGQGNVMAFDLWGAFKPKPRAPVLFSDDEIFRRCMLAVPFIVHSALGMASPAFLLSTLVGSPLLAAAIPLSVFFISSIVQFSPVLGDLKPYLPTRHMFFWDDVFHREIPWNLVWEGVLFHAAFIVFCVLVAILLFLARDVTS